MAREEGVRTVQAAPDGLYGLFERRGTEMSLHLPWEEVPHEIRQHLAAVYKYLNGEANERIQKIAATCTHPSWAQGVVCTCGQVTSPPADHGVFCPVYKAAHA